MKRKDHKGFSLIEVLLSSALFVLIVTAFVGALVYARESAYLIGTRSRALLLAEEGLEAIRSIRDGGYTNLINGTYGLSTTTNQWNLSGSSDATDIFTRTVTIAEMDTTRKLATSTVTWRQNAQRNGVISLVTRLTNWIAVAANPWVAPVQTATLDFSGTNDGRKIALQENYAYVVRSGGTPNFLIIDITTSSAPILRGSLSLTGIPTNIFVTGTIAYISNENNNQELQIINVSSPAAPSVLGSFNAEGTANANGVFVSGTMAYLVRSSSASNEFIAVNVSNPASPVLVGSLNLNATGYEVWISGTRAFVASGSDTQELQVVNISNPTLMTITNSINLPGTIDATTIMGFATTTLLGQGLNFRVVNVSPLTAPTLSGSLAVGGAINDIVLYTGNTLVFLATANTTAELTVVNIQTQVTPASYGTLNMSDTLNGVAHDPIRDVLYTVGLANTAEFTSILPQ